MSFFRSRVDVSEKLTSMEIAICHESFNPTTLKSVIHCDSVDSPAFSTMASSQKQEKPTSSSESYSTCSTQSSSYCCDTLCRAILQRSWKLGFPHFVFSFDNQTEEYAADLCKDGAFDCVDFFNSRNGREGIDRDRQIVGRMTVSTSFSLSPNNTKIKTTEFLMFGFGENSGMEIHGSRFNLIRKIGISKKLDDMFRKTLSSSQRFLPSLSDSNAVSEALPECELSAIVAREYVADDHPTKIGGWGLKFLQKRKFERKIDSEDDHLSKPGGWGLRFHDNSVEPSLQSESCARRSGYKSLEVIIPVGVHGGDRRGNGGHSSLIERWRSNGGCDCGGWDLGCPITVLKTKDFNGELNSIDLHLQDSARDPSPALRMVEVSDGSYFVFFRSSLTSSLQSFSVAVTAILSQKSLSLNPNPIPLDSARCRR